MGVILAGVDRESHHEATNEISKNYSLPHIGNCDQFFRNFDNCLVLLHTVLIRRTNVFSRFPVEGYVPLQLAPMKECNRAALLFKMLDALLDELARLSDLKPPVTPKHSKVCINFNDRSHNLAKTST